MCVEFLSKLKAICFSGPSSPVHVSLWYISAQNVHFHCRIVPFLLTFTLSGTDGGADELVKAQRILVDEFKG